MQHIVSTNLYTPKSHCHGIRFVVCICSILVYKSSISCILIKEVELNIQFSRSCIGHASYEPAAAITLLAGDSQEFSDRAVRNNSTAPCRRAALNKRECRMILV